MPGNLNDKINFYIQGLEREEDRIRIANAAAGYRISEELGMEGRFFKELTSPMEALDQRSREKVAEPVYKASQEIFRQMQELEKLYQMTDILLDIYGAGEDHALTSFDEKEEIIGELYSLQVELSNEYRDYRNALHYGKAELGVMVGFPDDMEKIRENPEAKDQWERITDSFTDPELVLPFYVRSSDYITEMNPVSSLTLDILSFHPENADPFLAADGEIVYENLKPDEKKWAVTNFDSAFNAYIYSEKYKNRLAGQGQDIFDMIYLNGQSLNERYAEKYSALTYSESCEAIKCEFMADLCRGQKVQAFLPQNPDPVSMNITSDRPQFAAVADGQKADGKQYEEAVRASRTALSQRDRMKVETRKNRIRNKQESLYEGMDQIDPYAISATELGDKNSSPELKKAYYNLRINNDLLLDRMEDDREVVHQREILLKSGRDIFSDICGQGSLDTNHKLYADAGIRHSWELFYIDGIPAQEYVENKYGEYLRGGVLLSSLTEITEAEIAAAAISGKHHVEAVHLGTDAEGRFVTGITEIRPDLTLLDGQEKMFERKPSRQMESFYEKDDDREIRQEKIRGDFSAKIVKAADARLREQEIGSNPYRIADTVFERHTDAMTEQYIPADRILRLDAAPTKGAGDLENDYLAGYRTYSELLLMSEHQDVRYADLMDPKKFAAEKKDCGARVTDAFAKLYQGPQTEGDTSYLGDAADIMKQSMQAIAEYDPLKEVLYALHAEELSDPEQIRALMKKPENRPVVDTVLKNSSRLAADARYVIDHVYEGVSAKEDTYTMPAYEALASRLDVNLIRDYRKADAFLRQFDGMDKKISGMVQMYEKGRLDDSMESRRMASDAYYAAIVADRAETMMIRYGKAKNVPANQTVYGLEEEIRLKVDDDVSSMSPNETMKLVSDFGTSTKDHGFMMQEIRANSLMNSSLYFREDEDKRYTELSRTSGIVTLDRRETRTSLAMLKLMADEDMTAQDLAEMDINAMREKCLMAGDSLTELWEENPYDYSEDITAETRERNQKSVAVYSKLYKSLADAYLSVEIPEFDLNDAAKMEELCPMFSILASSFINYDQTRQEMAKAEKGFDAAYGTREDRLALDNKVKFTGWFAKAAERAADPDARLNERFAGKYIIDQYRDVIMGKKASEIQVTEEMATAIGRDYMAVLSWSSMCDEDTMKQMEEYVSGNGKLPKEEEIREVCHESEIRAKEAAGLKAQREFKGISYIRASESEYFDHTKGDDYSDIKGRTGIDTMPRSGSRTSIACAYTMMKNHMTLEDIFTCDPKVKRQGGEDLLHMLRSNPNHEHMTQEAQINARIHYGEFYKGLSDVFLSESIPVTDVHDLKAMTDIYKRLDYLASMGIDINQSAGDMRNQDGFSDAFGGDEKMRETMGRIDFICQVAEAGWQSMRGDAANTMVRFLDKELFERFGPEIMGKPFHELPQPTPETLQEMADMRYVYITWYQSLTDKRLLREIDNYVNNKGPKPEFTGLQEIYDDCKESRKALENGIKPAERAPFSRIPKSDEYHYTPELKTMGRVENMFSLMQNQGRYAELAKWNTDRWDIVAEESNETFDKICMQLHLFTDSEVYKYAGISHETEFFYIDGMKAADYVEQRYKNSSGLRFPEGSEGYYRTIEAEILAASMSPEHYVNVARMGASKENGVTSYYIGVTDLTAGHPQMEKMAEGTGIRIGRPQDETKKDFYAGEVRGKAAAVIASAYNTMINEKAFAKTTLKKTENTFNLTSPELNEQYFGKMANRRLTIMQDLKRPELLENDYAMIKTYAQLVVLAENQDARLSDLADPEKLKEEKLAAGDKVTEAFLRYQKGLVSRKDPEYADGMAEVIGKSMKALADLDVRKDVLYAMGKDTGLKDQKEIISIMEAKENVTVVHSLMKNIPVMTDFVKAGERMAAKDNVLAERLGNFMTADQKKEYDNASRALSSLQTELNFAKATEEYMLGKSFDPETMAHHTAQYLMTRRQHQIIAGAEKASELPADEMEHLKDQEPAMKVSIEGLEKKISMDAMIKGEVKPEIVDHVFEEAAVKEKETGGKTLMNFEQLVEKDQGNQKPKEAGKVKTDVKTPKTPSGPKFTMN